MKKITSFEIDESNMSALAQSRVFSVSGDEGAVFNLTVTTPTKFYNFVSKTFQTSQSSETTLSNTRLDGGLFIGDIDFPADADGEVYTLNLIALPHFETEIDPLIQDLNNIFLTRTITQVADVVVTFQSKPLTTANFEGSSHSRTATATQSPTVTTPVTVDIDWEFENAATDAKGFGFIPVATLRRENADSSLGPSVPVDDSSFYAGGSIVINDTISDDGGGSSHFNYVVDTISDVSVGDKVVSVSSGSLSGTPTLTRAAIFKNDTRSPNSPFIKLSSGQVFANGVTLSTFSFGINGIKKTTGIDMVINEMTLTQTPLTKTVNGAVDNSTTITLAGTYGISRGAYLEGFGMDNSTNNPITEVGSPGASSGEVTVTVAQTLSAGTVLNVEGSSNKYTVKGSITINKFPQSNTTVFLDLDSILTLGTQSP